MAINVKDKLVTVESLGIAYSTEQGARQEADQALSTRIDNIVAPEGDPSLTEVSDARVSGQTTYNTLKARLDADQTAVGTEISAIKADLGDILITTEYALGDCINGYIRYEIENSPNGSIGGSRNTLIYGFNNGTITKKGDDVEYSFTVKSGWQLMKVAEYTGNTFGTFVRLLDLTSGKITLDSTKYYVFQIGKSPLQNVDAVDVPSDAVVFKSSRSTDNSLTIRSKAADAYETGKIKVIAENNATKIGKTQIAIGDISDIKFMAITDWRKGYIKVAPDEYGDIGEIGNSNNYLYTGISPSAAIKGDGKKYVFNVASGFALAQIAEYSGPTTTSFVRIIKATADPMPDYLELQDGMYYAITITKSPVAAIAPSNVDGDTLVLNTYVSKVDDAQMLATGKNLLQENGIKVGYTLDNTGEEVTDSDYKVSDFIAIPKKYTKNLLYTHAYSESGYSPIIAFYGVDKSYVEQSTSETFVQNENTYAYVKAVFPVADSKCAICFSNESVTPDYEPYKKGLLYKNDLNSYDKNVTSDGVITEIINTGLMYIGDEQYGYGTAHTAFGESCIKTTKDTNTASSGYDGERYQIDCSTFVLLMTMGITPECSRYHHTKNIPAQWGYRYNRLIEYEGYVYGVAQTGNTKRLYANSIAEYAYKNGYLFLVNDDMSNIRAGDIFFLSNQSSSYKFFENIGHCGMIVDTIPLEAGGQAIVTFEGNGGANCPCKIHTYNTKLNKMIYAARFPLTNINRKVKSLTNFVQSVSTVISGDSGDAVDIATVSLSENLATGKVYTVIAKCELPNDCYLQIKTNGMSHLGVANDNIAKRPDGRRSFKIFAKNVDTITQDSSITLQAKCTGSVSGNAILTEFEVVEGYVTSFC